MTDHTAPTLRAGIISDVHIGFTGHINPRYYGLGQGPVGDQDLWWEYVLRWFAHRGVDVIVCPGDMTNACDYSIPSWSAPYSRREMERFCAIFRKVFGGTDTQLVVIYGNHDDFVQREETANGGNRTHWQDVFGEPYSPIVRRTVNGYAFVGAHWGHEGEAGPAVAEAVAASGDLPVFYIQHDALPGTTCASDPKRRPDLSDAGLRCVRDYDTVVAFSGHTHRSITDERAIWQADRPDEPRCTSITCSTLNYGEQNGGLINGENLMTKQALYMTAHGRELRFERLSFWTPEMRALAKAEKTEPDFAACTASCGADWVFTAGGERRYGFARRAALCAAPEFPPEADIAVFRGDTAVQLYFPAALPLNRDDDLIFSYVAEAVDASSAVVRQASVFTEHHIDHDPARFAPAYQAVIYGLTPDTEYTFRVFARDCYGLRSARPLTIRARTLAEPRAELG